MYRGKIVSLLSVCTLSIGVSNVTLAEPFGLLNGRSADVSRSPDRAVEVGAVFGDYGTGGGDDDEVDYEHFGARYNYKYSQTTVLYGDIGQTEFENDFDGLTYGLGGFWQLDGIFTGSDFGVHASFHLFDLEAGDTSIDGNSIMVEAIFSGREAINQEGNMFLYGNIGINRLSAKLRRGNNRGESDSDTELVFGGGVVLQNQAKSGEFYVGLFRAGDFMLGAGYRHYLQ